MKVTYQVAIDSFNELVAQFSRNEALDGETVKTLSFAVNNDLQVRDYLLGGLPYVFGAIGSVSFVTEVLPLIEESERTPFYTLMSAYYHEAGDSDLAYASLVTGQALDPDYPLAQLLERVFQAGWPTEVWATMRDDLHPKVVELITSQPEFVIA